MSSALRDNSPASDGGARDGGGVDTDKPGRPLAERVREIEWYHRIALPGGIVTPGVNNSAYALKRLRLPALAGKSVLDVGAWDGFYSFEAARQGARSVLATDSFVWQGRWGQGGFKLAREALGLEGAVEDRFVDVMDLSPEIVGAPFDVVLFLGVLYHLRDPVTALERVSSVCGELLVLETETALNFLPIPAARLWPGTELNDDDSNWWSINSSGLTSLLGRFGFADVRVVHRTSLIRRIARGIRSSRGLRAGLRGSRVVIHARR